MRPITGFRLGFISLLAAAVGARQLQGLVTQGDLLRAIQADPAGEMPVIDAGTRSLIVAYPDERVFDAVRTNAFLTR